MDDIVAMLDAYGKTLDLPYLVELWLVLFPDGGGKIIDNNHDEQPYEYYSFDTLDELRAFLERATAKETLPACASDLEQLESHAYARLIKVLAQANVTLTAHQYRSLREVMHDTVKSTITVSGGTRKNWQRRAE